MPIPPPPPGPPAPPPPSFEARASPLGGGGASDPKDRNQLLQSIRQGAKLKKAVTNDRSQPLVGGGASKNNGRPAINSGNSVGSNSSNSGGGGFGGGRPPGGPGPGPLGLGDLFAGGIPKLKPVGSSGARGRGFGAVTRQERSPPTSHNSSHSSPSVHNSSGGDTHSINSYHSNSSNSVTNSPVTPHNMSFANNKPPPPPPPPSNLKPSEPSSDRKPINYGKPSLAPKPPGINGGGSGGMKSSKPNPPPKLPSLYIPPAPPMPSDQVDSGGSEQVPVTPPSAVSVNRAQSMRMPRTASAQSPNAASIEYRTMGRSAGREFAAMNATGQPPPPPRIIANGVNRVRMSPLRPPSARPPPPPNKAPPAVPPPPPPSSAPPPPRHRISPAPTPPQLRLINGSGSLGPLPPVPVGIAPPPPPTRNSSMRSVNSATSITSASSGSGSSSPSVYTGVDLESRFGHLFPTLEALPAPGTFMGMMKTYPSKNSMSHSTKRQPAPQPPTQMQLGNKMWANNTSSC